MSPEPTELTEAELAIHVAICEGSPEDCKGWRGRCVKSAEAARPLIASETALQLGRDCLENGLSSFLERLVGPTNAARLLDNLRTQFRKEAGDALADLAPMQATPDARDAFWRAAVIARTAKSTAAALRTTTSEETNR